MKFSKEELSKMEFNDVHIMEEEQDLFSAEDCCYVCGSSLDNLTVGFNEKEQLSKYECAHCGAVFVTLKGSSDRILLKGEVRNWPDYLMETLEFPFEAVIIESSDREFFDPNYDGPGYLDDVKVLEVFYSMKYGVEAVIRMGRKKYPQILCFMEATDEGSRNYLELENYKRWREKYWLSDYLKALLGI